MSDPTVPSPNLVSDLGVRREGAGAEAGNAGQDVVVRRLGPTERPRFGVVRREIALEAASGSSTERWAPRWSQRAVSSGKRRSTWVNQDAAGGAKCN